MEFYHEWEATLSSSVIKDYICFEYSDLGHEPSLILSWSDKGKQLDFSFEELAQKLLQNEVQCHQSISHESLRIYFKKIATLEENNIALALFIQLVQSQLLKTNLDDKPIQRLLITGISGWSAQFLFKSLLSYQTRMENLYDIVGIYFNKVPSFLLQEKRYQCNLSNDEAAKLIVQQLKPDIVIHLAAISSPIKCHENPRLAFESNCPRGFLEALREFTPNCLVLFASTDMVYDGEHSPYSPEQPCHPVNFYGRSKLSCEKLILQLNRSFVLRLSNMLGPPYAYQPAGETFLQFLFKAFSHKQYIGLRTDERRSFVFVRDVVEVILRLLQRFSTASAAIDPRLRVLNVGGPAGMSRMELASELTAVLSHDLKVHPKKQEEFSQESTSNTWTVYAMVSPENQRVEFQNLNSVHAVVPNLHEYSVLRSPRDITMIVSETERFLGFNFLEFKSFCTDCLQV